MHAIRPQSDSQCVNRLLAKFRHATAGKPSSDKTMQRRRKSDKRDFRAEIASVMWGPARAGCEL